MGNFVFLKIFFLFPPLNCGSRDMVRHFLGYLPNGLGLWLETATDVFRNKLLKIVYNYYFYVQNDSKNGYLIVGTCWNSMFEGTVMVSKAFLIFFSTSQ